MGELNYLGEPTMYNELDEISVVNECKWTSARDLPAVHRVVLLHWRLIHLNLKAFRARVSPSVCRPCIHSLI